MTSVRIQPRDAGARRILAREVREHPRAVADMRASLFRRHIELNVRMATPLMAIVSRAEGLDLDMAVGRIGPPRSWPIRPLSSDARRTLGGVDRDFAFKPAQITRRHRYAGSIVTCDAASGNLVGIRIVAGSVELTVVRGGLRLDTFHGFGRLMIEGTVPETIAMAMCRRPVSMLVDHPWLTDPAWKVMFVTTKACGSSMIVFETGRVPWRLRQPEPILGREIVAC